MTLDFFLAHCWFFSLIHERLIFRENEPTPNSLYCANFYLVFSSFIRRGFQKLKTVSQRQFFWKKVELEFLRIKGTLYFGKVFWREKNLMHFYSIRLPFFCQKNFLKNFFILFKFRFVKVFVRFLLLWNFRTNFYVVSSCFSRFCHLCSRWSPLR